jgi:hypothetical protein
LALQVRALRALQGSAVRRRRDAGTLYIAKFFLDTLTERYDARVSRVTAQRVEGPASVSDHAAADLRFIRHAMERSATFTAVPGWGGAAMGAIGLAASAVAAGQPSAERWLICWLIAAALAFAVGVVSMRRKAVRVGVPMTGAPGRRFAMSLAAPLVAGAALTAGLWAHATWALMPPTWLLLYGAGVLTGGAFSVAPTRVLGLSVMSLGVAALLTPPSWGNAWLGLGFGAMQVAFGIYIAREHGG